jgi:diguanylate cyclase (GGDEF)-like protein
MGIVIVDDSPTILRLLQAILEQAGYDDVVCADCGKAALRYLGVEPSITPAPAVDCILLDIVMPGIDGIEVCRRIKASPTYSDTPVIMVTVREEVETLRDAFMAGAHDYITKPVREVELVARLKAAITLKKEAEGRKAREVELIHLTEKLAEANSLLAELTITDDLTKVGNRRYFAGCLDNEWRRSFRESEPLSIIIVSIDHFQEFNEQLGRNKGDECLKLIAQVLQISLRRTTDHLARYSDHQFAIVLPKTPLVGARAVAGTIQQSIKELQVRHPQGIVTISQGVASVIPSGEMAIQNLLFLAEEAVAHAQKAGGNQAHFASHKSSND